MNLSDEILEKSIAAAISSIEVYNKPTFAFREETFSILMTSAWELMLKAKFIKDDGENPDAIVVMHKVTLPDGTVEDRFKQNRSGNAITFDVTHMLNQLSAQSPSIISKSCLSNILLLVEVRDNSVHFINKDLYFSRRIQEIGLASLKNYLSCIQEWFSRDLSCYNFYLMPLSFFHGFEATEVASMNAYSDQMKNLMKYIECTEKTNSSEEGETCSVTLRVETKLYRSKDEDALPMRFTNDPSAPAITVREEDALQGFSYEYQTLTSLLKKRYTDFVENQVYHDLRRKLEGIPKYCKVRSLNPRSPKSMTKKFYSGEIIKEFDAHYSKRIAS